MIITVDFFKIGRMYMETKMQRWDFMARPQRCRRICQEPAFHAFLPEGNETCERAVLSVDELEMVRLVDLEKKTHEQCAAIMEISRSTATEIYENARTKIADTLVNGKHLVIEGGNYRLCGSVESDHCSGHCPHFGTAQCCHNLQSIQQS